MLHKNNLGVVNLAHSLDLHTDSDKYYGSCWAARQMRTRYELYTNVCIDLYRVWYMYYVKWINILCKNISLAAIKAFGEPPSGC